MTLFVVHRTVSGYAPEDSDKSDVVGVYTDSVLAQKLALLSHAKVAKIELDFVPAGFKSLAKEIGVDLEQEK